MLLEGIDMDVTANFHQIQQHICDAVKRARRNPGDVTLIAVSKYASTEQLQQLIMAGHRDFAESRVQNVLARTEETQAWLTRTQADGAAIAEQLHWHMIGHLQRNKAALAIETCAMIHSVDSLRLAEHLNDLGHKRDKFIEVFMEVNTSGETTKTGVPYPAAIHMAEQFESMAYLRLRGLMTMARQSDNPDDARRSFSALRELFEELRFHNICGPHFRHLSMGMSGDFEIAIEEGATMVRIGSAIFGSHREPALEMDS